MEKQYLRYILVPTGVRELVVAPIMVDTVER
jgi:hypothetical protein